MDVWVPRILDLLCHGLVQFAQSSAQSRQHLHEGTGVVTFTPLPGHGPYPKIPSFSFGKLNLGSRSIFCFTPEVALNERTLYSVGS